MRVNRFVLAIVLIIVLAISFFGGYYISKLYTKNTNKELQNMSAVAAKFVNPQELVNSNTQISIKMNYIKSGLIYTRELNEKPTKDILGMDKTSLEKYYKSKDFNLIQFSRDLILLAKDINTWPPSSYIIKNNNGFIAIYEVNKDSNLIFKENTSISIESLPEEDRLELQGGKIFETIDEVYLLIEEYSS